MTEMEEERIRRRLLAVEKEAERLRSRAQLLGFGFLITLGMAGFALFFQGPFGGPGDDIHTGSLRTGQIVLEDSDGVQRGEWRVDEEGNSRLTILDRQGNTRLSLSVLNAGFPGLSFTNGNGQTRAALGLLPDESTSLVFADGAGVPRTVLGLSRADAAHLVFADSEGVSRVALGLDGDGEGSVILPEDSSPAEPVGQEGS
jgi:hypothetical protein